MTGQHLRIVAFTSFCHSVESDLAALSMPVNNLKLVSLLWTQKIIFIAFLLLVITETHIKTITCYFENDYLFFDASYL